MRFAESQLNAKSVKEKDKEKERKKKPAIKAGMKDYDYTNLGKGRLLPTKEGFQ